MKLPEYDWSEWLPLASVGELVDPHLDGPGVFEIRLAKDGEALPFPSSEGQDQRGVVFIGYAADSLRSQLTEFEETDESNGLSDALVTRRFLSTSPQGGDSAYPDFGPESTLECRWAETGKEEAPTCADERLRLYIWRLGDYPPLNEKPEVSEDSDLDDFDSLLKLDLEAWKDRPGSSPDNPIVYCADVGLVSTGRFGWTRSPEPVTGYPAPDQSDIGNLARSIAMDLADGLAVALGFECPLFIPLRDNPEEMRKARQGESNRPWSAAAGLGSLTVGLPQTVWLLRVVQKLLEGTGRAFINWNNFVEEGKGLFVWEAFVSGDAKISESEADSHVEDATTAVWSFVNALPNPEEANAIQEDSVHSLIGAALLRTGWSEDLELLSTPCLVLRS